MFRQLRNEIIKRCVSATDAGARSDCRIERGRVTVVTQHDDLTCRGVAHNRQRKKRAYCERNSNGYADRSVFGHEVFSCC